MKYETIDDWLYEQEGYALRAERLPPEVLEWVKEAWRLGALSMRGANSDETKAAADEIERLRAAVLAEREACARIADAWAEHTGVDDLLLLAAAIRARNNELHDEPDF